MKVRELTPLQAAVFSRMIVSEADYLELEEADRMVCSFALEAAKGYVSGYTGLSVAQMEQDALSYAVLVVAAEMIDVRQMSGSYEGENPTAKSIMDMYSMNLI